MGREWREGPARRRALRERLTLEEQLTEDEGEFLWDFPGIRTSMTESDRRDHYSEVGE